MDHVHLGTTHLIVAILLIPYSVLVEPVICLRLLVKRVAEVAWARRCDPVHRTVSKSEVIDELLVTALIILLHDAKVANRSRIG